VRIFRQSLIWATRLNTWNAFDWHLAKLLHKKTDCVKINRWPEFEFKDLLEGSDLKCEIKEKDLGGTIDAMWFRPTFKDRDLNKDKVMLYFHGLDFACLLSLECIVLIFLIFCRWRICCTVL
jgi:hypothetical protein